jgi:hypothetical protein
MDEIDKKLDEIFDNIKRDSMRAYDRVVWALAGITILLAIVLAVLYSLWK